MCHYADELAAFGIALRDDELVAYLLAKLDEDYNSIFTAIVARTNTNTLSELYAQLLSFDQHTSLQGHSISGGPSSAMSASRGRATMVVPVLDVAKVMDAVVVFQPTVVSPTSPARTAPTPPATRHTRSAKYAARLAILPKSTVTIMKMMFLISTMLHLPPPPTSTIIGTRIP
jgi:hypothetical protein